MNIRIRRVGFAAIFFAMLTFAVGHSDAAEPRIVNIYNFIRNSDYRVPHSEDVLFDTTRQQVELFGRLNLPVTWALQYDALMNPKYQELLKTKAGSKDDVDAWWEIPRGLAEKAGLKWRGAHDWDSTANVGFSPGYEPDDRKKLVDVYMADFKAIFRHYPRTVGSWYIDEVTLAYMADHYGIVASCNCKDQVGTDGYTLWGGYWNQAYYPSRLNAYMPAQTKAGQIDIPIFRMLGSDPIYQFANVRGIFSLEPVYPKAGGSEAWVKWFMDSMAHQPCLAFGYTQAGQENSFGWESMKKGLTQQAELLAQMSKAGEVRVETMGDSGKWFHEQYAVTPPTSVVAMDDWRHENRKSVWYDSRFYRANFLSNGDGFFIRDLHRFDENVKAVTHDVSLKTRSLAYQTLPIIDNALWIGKGRAGGLPVLVSSDNKTSPMVFEGPPEVKAENTTDLSITQHLTGGGTFSIVCREKEMQLTGVDPQGHALGWAINLVVGDKLKTAVQSVAANRVTYRVDETSYDLQTEADFGSIQQSSDGTLVLSPNSAGKLVLVLGQ